MAKDKKARLTKAQVVTEIAEIAELDKKSVARMFDALTDIIKKQLSPRGPVEFVIPGLVKLKVRKTKPRPAGERMDPFTKQMKYYPAKPAKKVVKPYALKALKEMAG